jgi:uncharacterized protein (TIGR02284 family)
MLVCEAPELVLTGGRQMASGRDHDIKQLNSLIELTLDSAHGYMDAADEAKSSGFSGLFRARAALRHEIAERLQARVKTLGGDENAHGTTRRWFANLRQKMVGDDTSLIAEVEAGERHVSEAYQKVVLDGELSDPVRAAVESEFAQIQANIQADRDKMRNLKQSVA